MNEIQERYRKAKRVYWALLVALLGIVIAFRFVAPPGEHKMSPLEATMFVLLLLIAATMYAVLRCPKCRAFLVPAYSAAWGRLRFCPKCGVALTADPKEKSRNR
jgi:hypothetical protein